MVVASQVCIAIRAIPTHEDGFYSGKSRHPEFRRELQWPGYVRLAFDDTRAAQRFQAPNMRINNLVGIMSGIRLRPKMRWPNPEALREQIGRDVAKAQRYFTLCRAMASQPRSSAPQRASLVQ